MTNDQMLEKFIKENQLCVGCDECDPEGMVLSIYVEDLRTFMAGKRIVEDVPVAMVVEGEKGYFAEIFLGREVRTGQFLYYAAPSDTEVGNG